MRTGPTIQLLCTETDRENLRETVEALISRGCRIAELSDNVRRSDIVLAVLSRTFYSDTAAVDRLLGLIGAGAENVLPLQIDSEEVPKAIKNVLYSRNIIPTVGRDAEHTAERIISAIPKKKSRLPLFFSAAALTLAVIAGILFWRASQKKAASVTEETDITVPDSLGLTQEDLAKIEDVLIVGEQAVFLSHDELESALEEVQAMAGSDAPFIYFDSDRYAVLDENAEDGDVHWYGMETGQELGIVHYDDLRFLSLMPNLRYLSLVLVDVPQDGLPDLRGSEKLEGVAVLSSGIDDLSWLSGASVQEMMIRFTPVRDFGALTVCTDLRLMHIDMRGTGIEADFSGFAPPGLKTISLWNTGFSAVRDLSSFSALSGLRKLQILEPAGLQSLAGLEKLDLEEFEIVNGFDLQDVSALASLKNLTSLTIDDCPSVRDFSPVSGCTSLESVMLYPGMDVRLRDASFLGALPNLREISLYSIDLPDLDFLRQLAQNRQSLSSFDFSGDVRDFSGLSAISHYDVLGIDLYGGSLGEISTDLSDASVSYLKLRRIADLDLASLPRISERLFLRECNIRDLSALPEDWQALRIQFYDCPEIRSLDGLERLEGLRESGKGILEVYLCPRISDWSALNGTELDTLILNGVYSLPDFASFHTGRLRLENVADVSDLEFLLGMDTSKPCSFELLLEGVQNLEPLRRFHGEKLTVLPQLADQAEDLVSAGNFSEYTVEYPSGGWQIDTSELTLESLEDLEILPKALLRRVGSVCIAGNRVIDPNRYEITENREPQEAGPGQAQLLRDRETGELYPLESGAIASMDVLSDLTGLSSLTLLAQPLTDLNGIQYLMALESFRAEYCEDLCDVSALFTLQSLAEISLRHTAAGSLQGVQNLYGLRSLDLSHTRVTDLTPLLGLREIEAVAVSSDMTAAVNSLNGQSYGFELRIAD